MATPLIAHLTHCGCRSLPGLLSGVQALNAPAVGDMACVAAGRMETTAP